ncbi:hypothetical protein B296_00030966 [Ensete ventricosum]|uniref:Uncharacterized protein n=1 Tax=Ensete ventricosum TaxID=4639 RepID=A0A426Z6P5_ENSVE|nr:hypothetical protein B296_00030966 [Ensete ventricosum]
MAPHVEPSIEKGPNPPLSSAEEGPHVTSLDPSLGPHVATPPWEPSASKGEGASEGLMQLSAKSDELVVAQVVAKEAKGAWEDKKNQASKWERRVMASYKEFDGFQCVLQRSSYAAYEFGLQITTGRFKVRYPKLEVDKDPYVELPSMPKCLLLRRFPSMITQHPLRLDAARS